MKKYANTFKITIGFIISGLFLYLAFKGISFQKMGQAFREANYILLIPTAFLLFLSHFLRSVRWFYFLKPIKKIKVSKLFSALLIGYMGNTILPAHLGEVIRGYVIGKKEKIPVSSVLTSIFIERILDVFTMIIIMIIVLYLFLMPNWEKLPSEVKASSYLMIFVTFALFFLMIILKKYTQQTMNFILVLLKPFPYKLSRRVEHLILEFVNGIQKMEDKRDYFYILILTINIWLCYLLILYINFYTFNIKSDHLNLTSALVVLVITTIAVLIPSSPGYIGTYHYLCQISLGLFGIENDQSLPYAIVVHAMNTFPAMIVGLILAWKEGISIIKLSKKKELSELTISAS